MTSLSGLPTSLKVSRTLPSPSRSRRYFLYLSPLSLFVSITIVEASSPSSLSISSLYIRQHSRSYTTTCPLYPLGSICSLKCLTMCSQTLRILFRSYMIAFIFTRLESSFFSSFVSPASSVISVNSRSNLSLSIFKSTGPGLKCNGKVAPSLIESENE